jgi:outer membrane scaffolding protein for murein synthesis (MipA/OmpV family)
VKRLLFILILALALRLGAAPATTNNTVTLGWSWSIPYTGGLIANDFLTNVNFQVYSSTNIATTNWVPYALLTSTNYIFVPPDQFSATVPATNAFLFFVATTKTGGGESPFSNSLLLLPVLPGPLMVRITGPP